METVYTAVVQWILILSKQQVSDQLTWCQAKGYKIWLALDQWQIWRKAASYRATLPLATKWIKAFKSATSAMIIFKFFVAILVIALANCQYEWPIPDGTTLCCPLYQSDSNCTSEGEVRSICPNGIVPVPCHHCKRCTKGIGESCGGLHHIQGICEEATLECTAETYPDAGVCVTLHKYRLFISCMSY